MRKARHTVLNYRTEVKRSLSAHRSTPREGFASACADVDVAKGQGAFATLDSPFCTERRGKLEHARGRSPYQASLTCYLALHARLRAKTGHTMSSLIGLLFFCFLLL